MTCSECGRLLLTDGRWFERKSVLWPDVCAGCEMDLGKQQDQPEDAA